MHTQLSCAAQRLPERSKEDYALGTHRPARARTHARTARLRTRRTAVRRTVGRRAARTAHVVGCRARRPRRGRGLWRAAVSNTAVSNTQARVQVWEPGAMGCASAEPGMDTAALHVKQPRRAGRSSSGCRSSCRCDRVRLDRMWAEPCIRAYLPARPRNAAGCRTARPAHLGTARHEGRTGLQGAASRAQHAARQRTAQHDQGLPLRKARARLPAQPLRTAAGRHSRTPS